MVLNSILTLLEQKLVTNMEHIDSVLKLNRNDAVIGTPLLIYVMNCKFTIVIIANIQNIFINFAELLTGFSL